MPNKTKRTPARVEKFLAILRRRANVSEAAAAIGVGRTAIYSWRASNQQFASAWDDAIEDAVDELEAEAWRRAVHGVDRPITWKGEITGTAKEYSDRLLECLLRANRPRKYCERSQLTVKADESFAELLVEARKRMTKRI